MENIFHVSSSFINKLYFSLWLRKYQLLPFVRLNMKSLNYHFFFDFYCFHHLIRSYGRFVLVFLYNVHKIKKKIPVNSKAIQDRNYWVWELKITARVIYSPIIYIYSLNSSFCYSCTFLYFIYFVLSIKGFPGANS